MTAIKGEREKTRWEIEDSIEIKRGLTIENSEGEGNKEEVRRRRKVSSNT